MTRAVRSDTGDFERASSAARTRCCAAPRAHDRPRRSTTWTRATPVRKSLGIVLCKPPFHESWIQLAEKCFIVKLCSVTTSTVGSGTPTWPAEKLVRDTFMAAQPSRATRYFHHARPVATPVLGAATGSGAIRGSGPGLGPRAAGWARSAVRRPRLARKTPAS